MHGKNNNSTHTPLSWSLAPETLTMDSNEIHVWRADLNITSDLLHKYHQLLSPDEQDRSARFKFQKDRERFIAAHGILRIILSRYLDIYPDQLHFSSNNYGKPFLDQPDESGKICFNMSHSKELALFALSCDREIGIDIERIRPLDDAEQIAQRFFSLREIEQLRALPEHMRNEGFFHCWVRKEAFIKARGKGLYLPLDKFDVSLSPGEPAQLLDSKDDPRVPSQWSLAGLRVHPDYTAALAAEGDDWQMECWQWSDDVIDTDKLP